MQSSNGNWKLLVIKISIAEHLMKAIVQSMDLGDEDTAVRLVAELAVFLISVDRKCVAKELEW